MHAGCVFAIRRGGWLGGLAMLAFAVVSAAPAAAETQIFTLFDFPFEDGTVVPELRIAYETQGKLAPGRDNAIVLLHEAFADRHGFDGLIGPGKVFDTDRYFVIAADSLGGGESSSPGDGGGQEFPRYTIRDMMAAEYALVSRGLGLTRLRAIVGRGMGAAIGLEWAIRHPEMPRAVVLLAPSARSDANFKLVIDLMISAIALDPDWNGGRYEHNPVEGLRHAGMFYYPWSVSTAYLDRIPPARLAAESAAAAARFAAWDANSLVLRYAACREHDVGAGFDGGAKAAVARATMPVLLITAAADRLVAPSSGRWLQVALPHAGYAEIPGDMGHRAIAAPTGTAEADFVERTIRGFLK